MRVRTNADATSAVTAGNSPESKTTLRVDLPAKAAVDDFPVVKGNGTGGTHVGTFFTMQAGIDKRKVVQRHIRCQRQVGSYHRNSDPRTLFGRHEQSHTTNFTQSGIACHQRADHFIISIDMRPRFVTDISDKSRYLQSNAPRLKILLPRDRKSVV